MASEEEVDDLFMSRPKLTVAATATKPESEPAAAATTVGWFFQPHIFGTFCGLFSALLYNVTNAFLRSVHNCDPFWVSAVKALPTALLMAPWLGWLAWRGEKVIPAPKIICLLILGSVCGQVGGNVPFQWALGEIGLALTVPLTLGGMIVFGAILGPLLLREPLTSRAIVSMVILILAMVVLTFGAEEARLSVSADDQPNFWRLVLGVSAAALSGLAYSILNVLNRYCVGHGATIPGTLLVVSVVGMLSLGGMSLARLGSAELLATKPHDLEMMLLAGLCNAVAFVALTRSLQLTSVFYVNALNATQATMAALTGILLFQEALSPWLVMGVALTILGLMLLTGIGQPKGADPQDGSTPELPAEES